jgi:hypothetical protein
VLYLSAILVAGLALNAAFGGCRVYNPDLPAPTWPFRATGWRKPAHDSDIVDKPG